MYDMVKRCLMSGKAFVTVLAHTKNPITLSNIDIAYYIKKLVIYIELSSIQDQSQPYSSIRLEMTGS